MQYAAANKIQRQLSVGDLRALAENQSAVTVSGAVHVIRDMGDFSFVLVRLNCEVIQCIYENSKANFDINLLREESCARFSGVLHPEKRAPHGFELLLTGAEILSSPAEALGFPVSKYKLNLSMETELAARPLVLRNSGRRARFKIQEGIVRGFRDFLHSQDFTEIHTPKIGAASAEGGANVFKMDYFGRKAFLAQSPQFYKQMMVAVYNRVFEAGSVFRAEKHNTTRHLNEYISLDFEMGYIQSFTELMDMETAMLQYVFRLLKTEYASQLEYLKIELPNVDRIPTVRFREAKELIAAEYSHKIKDPFDLEPEEETLIGRYFKEKYDSDFVFVTHYPSKKRPFYAMDDPEDPKYTLSFDLLFRGMEVTTGGQRIHDYQQQVEKMIRKGLDPNEFDSYLMVHKHGMPPHGGLGIGLERLCMKLIGDNNVRLDSLFPRDMSRLEP